MAYVEDMFDTRKNKLYYIDFLDINICSKLVYYIDFLFFLGLIRKMTNKKG